MKISIALFLLLFSGATYAQTDPPQLAEAKTRFHRALELYDEGNFEASRLEFEKSYELVPNASLYYNLGLIADKLRDYAKALTYFERFLAEANPNVVKPRRAEVEKSLQRLKARVGAIEVHANVERANVLVDDRSQGMYPDTGSIRVSVGQHRVTIEHEGKIQTQIVDVTGGDTTTIEITFVKETPTIVYAPPPPPKPQFVANRTPAIVGWATTAVLGLAAGATGIASVIARDDLSASFNTTSTSRIDAAESRFRALTVTTDVLVGTAIVAGVVALYFTIRPPQKRVVGSAADVLTF